MIRSSRHGALSRRILIAAAVALVPVIAGCEAGNNAPTLQWHQPTDGTLAHAGPDQNITIADAFVLGAPIGAVLQRGQSAGLFFGLFNAGPRDRLIAIKAPGIAQNVQLPAGGVMLKTTSRVLLTGPKPEVVLHNLVKPLNGGTLITIYLIFQKAGASRVTVPVMPMTSHYTSYSPPALVSPTTTGGASAHAKATGTPRAPSPSPSSTR